MQYWISQSGEKKGPLKEWDIRALIEEEKLTEQDLIWHADLPNWQSLQEYTAFRSYFEKAEEIEEVADLDVELEAAKKELHQKIEEATGKKLPADAIIHVEKVEHHHWVRRGFAKVFDLFLYSMTFFVIANFFGFPFGFNERIEVINIIFLIPFFVIEAFLLSRFGLTPGKAILGLRVRPLAGMTPLNFNRALFRSGASWLFGMALGLSPYFIISMILSYFTTKQRGLTTWDAVGRTKVETVKPISVLQVFNYILLGIMVSTASYYFILSHQPTSKMVGKAMIKLTEKSPEIQAHYRKIFNMPAAPKDPS